CDACRHRFVAFMWKKRYLEWDGQILVMPDKDSVPYIDWTGARQFYVLVAFLLLIGLLSAWGLWGCATDQATEQEIRLHFETMMNRSIGKATYEEFLLSLGPPNSKRENADTISGVWEEPSLRGERVRMNFDR